MPAKPAKKAKTVPVAKKSAKPRKPRTPIQATQLPAEGTTPPPLVDALAERHASETLHKVMQPLIESLMASAQGSEARFNSTLVGIHTVIAAHLGRIEHFLIHRFDRWSVENFRVEHFDKGKGTISCAHIQQVLAMSQGKVTVEEFTAPLAPSGPPEGSMGEAVMRALSSLGIQVMPDPDPKGKPDTNN